jgi:hypothetical protein
MKKAFLPCFLIGAGLCGFLLIASVGCKKETQADSKAVQPPNPDTQIASDAEKSLPENATDTKKIRESFEKYLFGRSFLVAKSYVLKAEQNYTQDLNQGALEKTTGWWSVTLKRIEISGEAKDIEFSNGQIFKVIGVSQYYRNFAFRPSNVLGMIFSFGLVGQTSVYRDIYLKRMRLDNPEFEPFVIRVLTDQGTGSIYRDEGKYICDTVDKTELFSIVDPETNDKC